MLLNKNDIEFIKEFISLSYYILSYLNFEEPIIIYDNCSSNLDNICDILELFKYTRKEALNDILHNISIYGLKLFHKHIIKNKYIIEKKYNNDKKKFIMENINNNFFLNELIYYYYILDVIKLFDKYNIYNNENYLNYYNKIKNNSNCFDDEIYKLNIIDIDCENCGINRAEGEQTIKSYCQLFMYIKNKLSNRIIPVNYCNEHFYTKYTTRYKYDNRAFVYNEGKMLIVEYISIIKVIISNMLKLLYPNNDMTEYMNEFTDIENDIIDKLKYVYII